ncbi:MAG: hypothetical protein ACOWW1_06250 [archaeon]
MELKGLLIHLIYPLEIIELVTLTLYINAEIVTTRANKNQWRGQIKLRERERDILRKTILKLLEKSNMNYTRLEKRVNASGYRFATTNTFKAQLQYLLNNKHIKRVSRGVYQITSKGQKYL